MRWAFWKKKKYVEEFIGYVEPLYRSNNLLMDTIQRANALGLKGIKVQVLERRSESGDLMLPSVWFKGERL